MLERIVGGGWLAVGALASVASMWSAVDLATQSQLVDAGVWLALALIFAWAAYLGLSVRRGVSRARLPLAVISIVAIACNCYASFFFFMFGAVDLAHQIQNPSWWVTLGGLLMIYALTISSLVALPERPEREYPASGKRNLSPPA